PPVRSLWRCCWPSWPWIPPSRPTCPLVPVPSASKLQWLTWSASAPFRARHVPVSGQFCEAAAEGSSLVPRFPVAFRPAGIRLSDHPVPPLVGVGPPLRSAYRATPGPRRGFHVPHGRDPTGEGALCTPGPRCSHDRRSFPGRRCRFPAAGPAPSAASHLRGLPSRGINERSLALTRPVFPLPVAPV